MECPGCGSIIPADAKQCPLCKYVLQTADTGALPGDATLVAALSGGATVRSSARENIPTQIRPYPFSYWPLMGLAGGGIVVLIVISLLVGNLLQGRGLAIIAPTATATPTFVVVAGQSTLTATESPTTGITATPVKGRPTAVSATPTHSIPGTPGTVVVDPTAPPTSTSTPTATVTPSPVFVTAIHCGGGAVGQYQADTDVVGGNIYSNNAAINTSGVSDPAPQSVYQSERWGEFTYTLPGLTPGASYIVRLHFAEIYFNQTNQRQFNVSINGQQVLSNFDIVAAAGASNQAIVEQFAATADAQGQIAIAFITGAYNNPKCSGIELLKGVLPNG